MHRFRATKYNPALRDSSGAYAHDDWTSFRDIGRAFADGILTEEEYLRVEAAYIDAALAFLVEDRAPELRIVGLEVRSDTPSVPVDGSTVDKTTLADVFRAILREEYWCRLECGRRYVHFGWDYYMYIGVESECRGSIEHARSRGLYVEPFPSPYDSE